MEAPGRSPDAITIRSVFSASQQKLVSQATPTDQFVHDELLLKIGVLFVLASKLPPVIPTFKIGLCNVFYLTLPEISWLSIVGRTLKK